MSVTLIPIVTMTFSFNHGSLIIRIHIVLCFCFGYVFLLRLVLFQQEVIEAIAECAFKTSPFPVILSFENHVDS